MKSTLSHMALLMLAAAATACGSSDSAPAKEDSNPPDTSANAADSGTTEPDVTDHGSGLPDGILTGTNGTMPCDPLLDTGYGGDELCVQPADLGTGAFLHAGPSDYDNPDEVATFLLGPGDESTEYFVAESTNDEMIWFRDQHYRLRPGSHHLIMYTISSGDPPVGWIPDTELDRGGPIGGTQIYAMDFPQGGNVAPEDVALARPIDAHTRLAFELHYVNPSSDTIMREAWVNLMTNTDVAPGEYTILGAPFLIGAKFAVPPQTTQVLNYQYAIPQDTMGAPMDQELRIVSLFGHRHASTSRFSIWMTREGARELVYEDYDWADAREFFYNSVIQNPTPDPNALVAGAVSGIQTMRTGDIIEWECEMTNTLDTDLVFGNGVYVKEMCNVFGTLTATRADGTVGYPILYIPRAEALDPTVTTL